MDKRTLLAFALIFLVWFGWSIVYKKMYPAPEGGAGIDSMSVVQTAPSDPAVTARDTREITGSTPDEIPAEVRRDAERDSGYSDPDMPRDVLDVFTFIQPTVPHRAVTVSTPLYEVTLSTRGGQFTSWRGKEYRGIDGGPVELIPQDAGFVRGADAVLFPGRELDLSLTPFVVQGASEDPGLGDLELVLNSGEDARSVVLLAETTGGLLVSKTYTFHPDRYDIGVQWKLLLPSSILSAVGEPTRTRFTWDKGIASTELDKKTETPSFRSFGRVGDDLTFCKRQDIKKPDKVNHFFQGSVRYAGLQNKYFHISGIIPQETDSPVVGAIRLGADLDRNQLTWATELPLRRETPGQYQEQGWTHTSNLLLYMGPTEVSLLEKYGVGLEETVELGWKVFRPLSELILTTMTWMYRWIPNYGIIIIILSVVTKLMFYPLTRTSTKSMKKMQEIQPKLKALQEKYKDNKQKQSEETMKLYKEEGVNPMAGCLPLLVQSPVFIALFQALRNTIALRQAPFALWMKDLSQPDALFQFPFTLPLFGASFNLLPILMSASMYLQTKLTPTPSAGGQMAIMNTMLPIMMLVFFYTMPSGLVLYWLVNTVMTIYQTWRIHKTAPSTGGAKAS